MCKYEKTELEESVRQFLSLINKTEKVLTKLKEGTPQYTLSARRLTAYKLALSLIQKQLNEQ